MPSDPGSLKFCTVLQRSTYLILKTCLKVVQANQFNIPLQKFKDTDSLKKVLIFSIKKWVFLSCPSFINPSRHPTIILFIPNPIIFNTTSGQINLKKRKKKHSKNKITTANLFLKYFTQFCLQYKFLYHLIEPVLLFYFFFYFTESIFSDFFYISETRNSRCQAYN